MLPLALIMDKWVVWCRNTHRSTKQMVFFTINMFNDILLSKRQSAWLGKDTNSHLKSSITVIFLLVTVTGIYYNSHQKIELINVSTWLRNLYDSKNKKYVCFAWKRWSIRPCYNYNTHDSTEPCNLEKFSCSKYQPIKKLEDKNITIEGRNLDMVIRKTRKIDMNTTLTRVSIRSIYCIFTS
jgi:hypothetical protein